MRKIRVFVADELPGLGEAIFMIFSKADGQLYVLHTVRDVLNHARKKDQEALAENLTFV